MSPDDKIMSGNIVFDKHLNSITEVDEIDFECLHNIDPVIFNAVWCKALPFVEVGVDFGIWEIRYSDRLGCLKVFRVVLLDEGGAFVIIEDGNAQSEPKAGINLGEFKHVHEIQNLFYILANKPLEVIAKVD